MSAYRTKFHRDGSVTLWNVFEQQWQRIAATTLVAACEQPFGNLLLPTLSREDRTQIERMADRHPFN